MVDDFSLEPGKTYYPVKRDRLVTDDLVRGDGWKVEKTGDGFIFSFLAARHGGGMDRHAITAEEFALVREDRLSFADLLKKYDVP